VGPLAPLGINLTFLISQIVNFILLLLVLRLWAWKPILSMLEKRKQAIAQGLEDARVAAEARANAEKEAAEILARAQKDAAQVVREASERAEKVAHEIKAGAEGEAKTVLTAAAAEAEQARLQHLGELRGQVAALAMAATQKLIGESLDEKRQRSLLSEFFSGVKGGKVVVLEGEAASGATSAEVTTALPLTAEEQETVRKDVLSRMSSGATTSFRVDTRILGGMVIRIGDRVVDGSVAGKLENLRQSLQ
jgi:F-type H+-transporting ATPase subunit b